MFSFTYKCSLTRSFCRGRGRQTLDRMSGRNSRALTGMCHGDTETQANKHTLRSHLFIAKWKKKKGAHAKACVRAHVCASVDSQRGSEVKGQAPAREERPLCCTWWQGKKDKPEM